MGIAFIDPRPPARTAPDIFTRRNSKSFGKTMTVGMLANGFPDSASFLGHLAKALTLLGGDFRWEHVAKDRPPDVLTVAQLSALAACDTVIAAYGH